MDGFDLSLLFHHRDLLASELGSEPALRPTRPVPAARKVAVLSGSFNPPTIAHQVIAENDLVAVRGTFKGTHRGASFFGDLVNATGLLRTEIEKALAELVAWGFVTSDSFAGLRALLIPSDRRRPIARAPRRRGPIAPFGVDTAGRWSRARPTSTLGKDQLIETLAWQLLRRWGVVFRRLVEREGFLAPWRDVLRAFRRLEARGEVRGGRFVSGFSGEQYALPEAVGLLRAVRRDEPRGELVAVSGADPLNLVGIVTPGDPVPALTRNRVLYRDGIPVAVRAGEGQAERYLVEVTPADAHELHAAMVRTRAAPLVRAYLARR